MQFPAGEKRCHLYAGEKDDDGDYESCIQRERSFTEQETKFRGIFVADLEEECETIICVEGGAKRLQS